MSGESTKKLFLSHHSERAGEVLDLAHELSLRGIVPWIDKHGGLNIGDYFPSEARRAIREDCFGLLLYATDKAFDRPIIRDIELDEAKKCHLADPNYLLFAVPRGISFTQLSELSISKLGFDLSPFHTVNIPDGEHLTAAHAEVSRRVLKRMLAQHTIGSPNVVPLQFSTRELLDQQGERVLCINAVPLLAVNPANTQAWERLLIGLRDVKREIAASFGRPCLQVDGSKHLSAAFMFGRVFSPFRVKIRQTDDDWWATYGHTPKAALLTPRLVTSGGGGTLFVEVSVRSKGVSAAVDQYLRTSGIAPDLRLQFQPAAGPLTLDDALCRATADQVYSEIEKVAAAHHLEEIHLFVSAPQSFMMMLGQRFKGLPLTSLHEWTGTRYVFACSVPAGAL